jgi:integrase
LTTALSKHCGRCTSPSRRNGWPPARRTRLGSHGGHVAADELGGGHTTPQLRTIFYRLGEAAGVRKITFHHARHSTLSYLLNSGQVPSAIVAAWAGHADGGALKHYIRTRPGDLEAARDAIAELLGA